jgi:hypothetical protein
MAMDSLICEKQKKQSDENINRQLLSCFRLLTRVGKRCQEENKQSFALWKR